MTRLTTPTAEQVPAASRPILDAVNRQLGSVPNLFRVLASSPAALTGLTNLSGALSKALDLRTRERIAIAVAQVNGCDYCLSAHTYLAANLAKVPSEEIALNRQGRSGDAKADSAMRFAVKVARERGRVTEDDIAAIRSAGYSDAQIVEIVAVVAENFFTNLINNVARTEIDFPAVSTAQAA
jgi:uncharacterized peroxidase-related enzyme